MFLNPLVNGFTVPKDIGEVVEQLHPRPFLWCVSEFAKFTMRLSENQAMSLDAAKASVGLTKTRHPTFGCVIRVIHDDWSDN